MNNVKETNYGYDIIWTETESYCGMLLVFNDPGCKMPMHFHKETTKSWFINNGTFRVRWIDTADGQLYEKEIKEGSVFHVPPCMPVSLESLIAGGSVSQVSNQNPKDDVFNVIPPTNIGDN